ncbi:LOW QUALITY PROTEIN: putative F-box/LRR-repeat protein At1g56400 [Oryza glaberrima]|uniref:LOW QUALITY PROTEIN: putative F-box/LRR-repeat protein At1g56400 n=1 Tax=Oryza glaberrima TaxID=4538 RepID=UPI00224C1A13|nr:LOW QUALITY PROTEIN: putative F-box/LRR-repeat protein At1g56400 [Oryza glaberrima]
MPSPPPTSTMAAAAAVDRISDLPDDLLQRVLHFVPAKEAASTSLLSSRWRSLWRSTGAVNLAVHVRRDQEREFFSVRDAFVRSAHAALAAAGGHVTRLTVHVETERICMQLTADAFLHRDPEDWERKHDVVAGVVSHPVARRVEELRVAAAVVEPYWPSFDGEVTSSEGEFRLCLGAQPSETLRVLDLAGCGGLSAAAAGVALPRLTTLRLRLCNLQIGDLQGIIDAAPELAAVRLESVFLAGTAEEGCVRLRFPAATTALAMINCGADCYACGGCFGATEIDAPRLRSFKYTGFARRFSLVSPAAAPPDDTVVVARAELHFLDHFHHKDADGADMVRANFWRFLHNFRGAKSLKLKVSHLKHIAVAAARRELLLPLHGVERLDLTARHGDTAASSGRTTTTSTTVAIANLLRCCPNLRDLAIRLTRMVPHGSTKNGVYAHDLLREQRRADLDESARRFARRRRRRLRRDSSTKTHRDMDDVSGDDIPGLSGRIFHCLRSSLRRVGIQFHLDEHNDCIGVRLIKFFAENAICLEEMCIDGGNQRMHDHINHMVERWIADRRCSSAKSKNGTGSSSQPGVVESGMPRFRVSPLQRR